jgi:acyl-CoA synthetase (AMP-forming)/AMP-acid ligase II
MMTTAFREFRSVAEVIRHRAASSPSREAVRFLSEDAGGTVTRAVSYAELDRGARTIAAELRRHARPGCRVLLLYPTGIAFVTALLACIYADFVAVPAPLPGRYEHQRLRLMAIARGAGASAVLTELAHLQEIADWARAAGGTLPLIATDSLQSCDQDLPAGVRPDRGSLLLLQYTSGSTGDPKGAMLTHHNVLHNVASLQHCLGFSPETRFGGWIPLYHDMGLFTQLMPALLLGSTCVLMPPTLFVRRPRTWLQLITTHQIGCSAAPNFAFDLCCQRITEAGLAGLDLSRWEIAINGSEPIASATLRRFVAWFGRVGFRESAIRPCYGLAEATVFVSGAPARRLVTRPSASALPASGSTPGVTGELVSSGRPVGHRVCIVDPVSMKPLGPREVGEIWIRGANVARGYFNNPAATGRSFNATTADGEHGFLRSGDLGMIDEGELYVIGRIKDLIVIHGRKLHPHDIEATLKQRYAERGLRFGAVFSVPVGGGEGVVILQEIRGGSRELPSLAADIRTTVIQEFGVPVAGVLLLRAGSIERTTSGKVRRTAMREKFMGAQNALEPLFSVLHPSWDREKQPDLGARWDQKDARPR